LALLLDHPGEFTESWSATLSLRWHTCNWREHTRYLEITKRQKARIKTSSLSGTTPIRMFPF